MSTDFIAKIDGSTGGDRRTPELWHGINAKKIGILNDCQYRQ